MVDGGDSAGAPGGNAAGDGFAAQPDGGKNPSGSATRVDGARGRPAKPVFSEEQHRWIGGKLAREEDRRRSIEAERDGEREKVHGLSERIGSLERENRQVRAENAIIAAAARARAENPAHIYRMLRDDLQYDDQGLPMNVDAAVEQFRREHPRYFSGTHVSGADGGRGSASGNTATDMDAVLRDAWQNSKIRVNKQR